MKVINSPNNIWVVFLKTITNRTLNLSTGILECIKARVNRIV